MWKLLLPANASRAFLMSSALRMLLIAISAVNRKTKRATEVKNKVARVGQRQLRGHSPVTPVTLWKRSRKPGHVRRRWCGDRPNQ